MSTETSPTILVVDDEKNIRGAIELALGDAGMRVILAHDAASAWRALEERMIDAMVLDIKLGDVDGIAFFRRIQTENIAVPTIFISGHATLQEAAQTVKLGAFDFLEKPFTAEKIAVTVQRCLEFSTLRERLRLVEERRGSMEIVGDSPAICKVIGDALKVAQFDATVLITGESGTGKELVANFIHANSARRAAPLVKVNCSAIPDSLIETELFGHERGAFTGASGHKRGLFEIAHHGTLLLDEVGDLSLSAQAKILRVLQSGDVQKVGSERFLKVEVRVLAATHKDLEELVSAGTFREDLLYRLNVVPIRVPSLKERPQDIALLATYFAARVCQRNNLREKPIDDEVLGALREYSWPGNIRELQNVMERMMILSGDRISMADLPDSLATPRSADAPTGSALRKFRDEAEREFIVRVLRQNRGNISRAAVNLGIGRAYLHRRLAVLGIQKKDWLT
jgi:DNA-binding NtrC family response regulator